LVISEHRIPVVRADLHSADDWISGIRRYDAAFFGPWDEQLRRSLTSKVLDEKSASVIVVGLHSLLHVQPVEIERSVDSAFEHGASIAELLEAILHVAILEGGLHCIHDGFEAVENTVAKRSELGLPSPTNGQGLRPEDMIPESPFAVEHVEPVPPVFPYMSPSPRLYMAVWDKFAPASLAAFRQFRAVQFNSRQELSRRSQELLIVAVDAMILWPAPLIDHHVHAAFNVGATLEEQVDTVLLAATQQGGVAALHHGLAALDRVVKEREEAGVLVPRSAGPDVRQPE